MYLYWNLARHSSGKEPRLQQWRRSLGRAATRGCWVPAVSMYTAKWSVQPMLWWKLSDSALQHSGLEVSWLGLNREKISHQTWLY